MHIRKRADAREKGFQDGASVATVHGTVWVKCLLAAGDIKTGLKKKGLLWKEPAVANL